MWGNCTVARKRLQQRMIRLWVLFMVIAPSMTWLVQREQHERPGNWVIYFFAVLPAVPMIAVVAGLGRYLQEETDEFQRLVVIRSLLVGTAAMLGIVMVSDILRASTPAGPLPPFVSFVIFCVGFGVTQLVQTLQNRPTHDDEPVA